MKKILGYLGEIMNEMVYCVECIWGFCAFIVSCVSTILIASIAVAIFVVLFVLIGLIVILLTPLLLIIIFFCALLE